MSVFAWPDVRRAIEAAGLPRGVGRPSFSEPAGGFLPQPRPSIAKALRANVKGNFKVELGALAGRVSIAAKLDKADKD